MTTTWIRIPVLLLAVGLYACSSSGNDSDTNTTSDGQADLLPDGGQRSRTDTSGPDNPSPAFRYNGDVCKTGGPPQSAVTTLVTVDATLMAAFAAQLQAEGYEVYQGPEAPPLPTDADHSDAGTIEDIQVRELPEPLYDVLDGQGEDGMAPDQSGFDVPLDVPTEEPWTGGPYVVARTPLSDLIFLLESGTMGVVSWCPAHSLGQIRRLDYALADAMAVFGEVAALDYATETEHWMRPASYYTTVEGQYQRSYMNESLNIDEAHSGQLTISGKALMAAVAIYGHADVPSQVGDQVGMDLLQVGQTIIAEYDSVTVTGQVVRLWDITPLAGEGELPVIIDAAVQDETINWQEGVYRLFADVIFPETVHGSFVLNLQGSPPGKLILSKSTDDLIASLPPLAPLF